MTTVDTVTGEIVEVMDREQAEKVTRDIKAWAGTLWLKIEEAHRGRAWLPLGYETWEAYLDAEFDISRSRGYQLVSHARAVRSLAEAAGVDVSTIVDIPEGQTRGVDPAAVAADVESKVTTTTTTEERTSTVRSVLAAHAEFARRAAASQSPPTPPGDETGAQPEPAQADEADEDMSSPSADPEQGEGDAPSGAPSPAPDDLASYLINALKAESATRKGLLTFDPERLVLTSRDHAMWVDLAADLRGFAEDLTAAVTAARPLRRVK